MSERSELRKYLTQLTDNYGLYPFFNAFSNLAWEHSQVGSPQAGQWRRMFIALQDVLIACQHPAVASTSEASKTEEPIPIPDLVQVELFEPLAHLTEAPSGLSGLIEEMTYLETAEEAAQVNHLIDQIQLLLESGEPLNEIERANLRRKLDHLFSQLESNS